MNEEVTVAWLGDFNQTYDFFRTTEKTQSSGWWFQAIPSESGNWSVPSGKRLHNYGKIQHFQMGKLPEGMI